MKKKILISTSYLKMGGIERSLINLLKYLDYEKYEVDLFLIKKEGELLNDVSSKVNIYEIEKELKVKTIILKILCRIPLLYKRIIKKTLKKEYDYSIGFSGYNNISDILAGLVNSKKKYIWVHSDYKDRLIIDPKFNKQFNRMKYKYKYFDNIISVSKGSMESFKKLFPKYKKNIDYCYNLINEEDIKRKLKGESNIKLKGDIKIIAVGRLVKQKGLDRFVDIIEKLNKTLKDKKIMGYIVGDGIEKENLVSKVNEKKLNKNIIFLGQIDNPFPIIKQADIFLFPSYVEGFPLVLIEALLCNVPIVFPKISSFKEIIDIIPKNSYILTNNNTEDLYKGVIEAVKTKNEKIDFKIEDYNNIVKKQISKIVN